MNILVLNSGSSSLKYQLINMNTNKPILKGHIDGIGLKTCKIDFASKKGNLSKELKIKNHKAAVKLAIESLEGYKIKAIGHRVVHGGELYSDATLIDKKVIQAIDKLSELAPLHNPPNLAGIKACKKLFPNLTQVAVFDTAFHQTIPEKAYLYGIPLEYYKKYGIRKYGFHGTSHKYVMLEAQKHFHKKKYINVITCHLGNGASIAAIEKNKSVDTSMGFTPLPGLIMGTRSGDIDPAIVSFLMTNLKKKSGDVIQILNKQSGLLGISGYSDMRTIHKKASKNKFCRIALDMFVYRVVQYIGSYFAVLKKVDAIVFTAGLGEEAYYVREKVCKSLVNFGVILNKTKNKKNARVISSAKSDVKVLVISTNEELMIAKETLEIIKN